MDNEFVWVINTGEKPIEICVHEWGRFVTLAQNRPAQLPRQMAMECVTSLRGVKACDHPEKYFNDRPQRLALLRDGGIGDLLLLEPIIRQMRKDSNREITVITMHPAVFANHPDVFHVIQQKNKELNPIKPMDYDFLYDYRNFSEQNPNRNKIHRTDIYALKNGCQPKDKNPRLYFKKGEKNNIFVKEKGKTYYGLACDGSHSYRRYDRGVDLADHILAQDPTAIIVVLGAWDFVKIQANPRILDLQGKTTVRDMINIVRDLDYLFAVDTGILHVALTLHTPAVGLFSICSPEFRVSYYDGPRRIIRKDLPCKGCGDNHMFVCKHGDKTKDFKFIPPCLDVSPQEIWAEISSMDKTSERRVFFSEVDNTKEQPKLDKPIQTRKKLWMPIIVLNEEKNLPRFIDLVMSHPCIEKVIAIDGGSTDNTVKLLQDAGAFVYIHPYDKDYHDMQAMQRNYSCSFIPDGQKIIIMDIDECFSKDLSDYLSVFAESNIVYAMPSRRTFNLYEDITDPNKQIKDYPDYQPRMFTWNRGFKWAGSPHHAILNVSNPIKINKDIIHFEKEGKDREALEKKWSDMQAKTREVYK
jgi:ADP-heptose:LPS heptosyltransferase